MSLVDWMIRGSLGLMPRSVVWTVARRYVAGSELEDALARLRTLTAEGYGTILDVLGEGISAPEQAREAAAEYHRALAALEGVDPECALSVKPTHLGLTLDPALCEQLLRELCVAADEAGRRVRFEMEDSPTIDGTLEVFSRVRADHHNLGCVLQSRLFRTEQDVARLLADGPGLDVRLVKGIYLEPEAIAWTEDADITASYERLAEQLVQGGARVAFATHHTALADRCIAIVRDAGWCDLPTDEQPYEFQLLMGVRAQEAARLRGAGHRVRIYVPYGKDWHAYSMRRLQHNPQIARHIIKAVFSRG